MCPCAGGVDPDDYRRIVERTVRGLTTEPDLLLAPLAVRITELAADERFEEAADMRDRADALASALRKQRRFDLLRNAGRMRLELPGQGGAELEEGRLVRAWGPGDVFDDEGVIIGQLFPEPTSLPPLDRELADELNCVAAWLDRSAHQLSLEHCDGVFASALPQLPSFAPKGGLSPLGRNDQRSVA